MVQLSLRTVKNGYILREGKDTVVFTSLTEVTRYFNGNYPVPSSAQVTLVSFPRDKQIFTIKVIREFTGMGLKESKDVTDRVRDGVPQTVTIEHEYDRDRMLATLRNAGAEAR